MFEVEIDRLTLRSEGLSSQMLYSSLEGPVKKMLRAFERNADKLKSLRIWLISSTARGGGVAEMLPRIVSLMTELGVECHWLIIEEADADRQKRFFALTKKLHNAIHDSGGSLRDWWPNWVWDVAAEAERVGFRSKALDLFACEGNGGAPHVTGGGLTITGSGHGVAGSAPPLDRRTSSPGMEGGPSPPTATPSATAEFTPLAAHPEVTAGAPGQPGHGGAPQLPSPHDEPINMRAFRYLYERVNDANAEAFLADFAPRLTATRDMVIIHDPQPAGMVTLLRQHLAHVKTVFRSHIGLDEKTETTESAWQFLRPYITQYTGAVFSAAEYVPTWMKERSFVVHPGISPLAPKNRELSPFDVTQILMRAGLMQPQFLVVLASRGCQLIEPAFVAQARIYDPRRAAESPAVVQSPLAHGFHPSVPSELLHKIGSPRSPAHGPAQAPAVPGQPMQHVQLPPSRLRSVSGPDRGAQSPTAVSVGSETATSPGAADRWSTSSTEGGSGSGTGVMGAARAVAAARAFSQAPPGTPIYRRPSSADLAVCFSPDMLDSGIAFLHRPIVTQISRWDRLKGWIPLMRAWVDLKTRQDWYVDLLDHPESEADSGLPHQCLVLAGRDRDRHRRTLRNACLVLAGPDPRAIADDPEGLEVLQELKDLFDSLPREVQRDIKLVELPMADAVENAHIVNAIQRASNIVVQCSSREGFGLTATEALYKRVAFIGTSAVGLRTQVRHLQDGYIIRGDPSDYRNVAQAINVLLGHDELTKSLAINGQKRAVDRFLVHSQMVSWIEYSLRVMGVSHPQIRRTQSAPNVMALLQGGLAAIGGTQAAGGARRERRATVADICAEAAEEEAGGSRGTAAAQAASKASGTKTPAV